MEYADIELRLKGSLLNTISKTVTVAEAVLLDKINGEGAIPSIQVKGLIEWDDKRERERLVLEYGNEIVNGSYPGTTTLPKTFVAAGLIEAPVEKSKKG